MGKPGPCPGPASDPNPGSPADVDGALSGGGARWRGLALVALLAGVLVGARLGAAPLLDPDEARHALAALEMLESGAWVEPTLNLEPYRHKLSPFYLLMGVCYRLLGVNETAARLVPALCAWLTLLAVYWFASRRGVRRGLLAALLLGSCGFFVLVGRFAGFDAPFTFLVSTAAMMIAGWFDGGGRVLLRLAYVVAGLAVLAKGPVALVLLGVPGLATLAMSPRRLADAEPVRGAITCVVMVGAWLVPAWMVAPEYVAEFLMVHNFQRFFGDSSVFHPEPLLFFVPVLAAGLLPWTFHVPASIVAALRAPDAGPRYLAMCCLWIVVFFSLSSGKLATYVLPAFPVAAVLTAWWVAAGRAGRGRAQLKLAAVASALVVPVGVALLAWYAPEESAVCTLFVPLTLCGGIVLLRPRMIRSTAHGLSVLCGGATLSVLAVNLFAAGALGRYASDRDLALVAQQHDPSARALSYRVQPYSFLFYSRRPLEVFYGKRSPAELGDLAGALLLSKPARLGDLDAVLKEGRASELASNSRHVLLSVRRSKPEEDRP